jgi:hypothetical protein
MAQGSGFKGLRVARLWLRVHGLRYRVGYCGIRIYDLGFMF